MVRLLPMDSRGVIPAVFGVPRSLIGVLHVGPLPGAPGAARAVKDLAAAAVQEARIYATAGFHGLILENTFDRPYLRGAAGPEIVSAMTAIAVEIRRACSLPLGIQILAGANLAAMAAAHASGAAFVRVEGFVFAHVADEGMIESDAGDLLRYRKNIGADPIRVFADIKKKHSAHAITSDVFDSPQARAAEFFLADGVSYGPGHPFSGEKLSVVTAVYKFSDLDEAIERVQNILDYQGAGHSCGIHTNTEEHARTVAARLRVARVLVNQAHCFGTGGSFDNGLAFTLTMGAGTWAGNSISDNLSYRHFLNITRLARVIPPREPSESDLWGTYFAKYGR